MLELLTKVKYTFTREVVHEAPVSPSEHRGTFMEVKMFFEIWAVIFLASLVYPLFALVVRRAVDKSDK